MIATGFCCTDRSGTRRPSPSVAVIENRVVGSINGMMYDIQCYSIFKSLSNIEKPTEQISWRRDNIQVHAFQKRNGTILRQGKADR